MKITWPTLSSHQIATRGHQRVKTFGSFFLNSIAELLTHVFRSGKFQGFRIYKLQDRVCECNLVHNILLWCSVSQALIIGDFLLSQLFPAGALFVIDLIHAPLKLRDLFEAILNVLFAVHGLSARLLSNFDRWVYRWAELALRLFGWQWSFRTSLWARRGALYVDGSTSRHLNIINLCDLA